jgi:hypothetical protein
MKAQNIAALKRHGEIALALGAGSGEESTYSRWSDSRFGGEHTVSIPTDAEGFDTLDACDAERIAIVAEEAKEQVHPATPVEVNAWGIPFPRLLLEPYKLEYRNGRARSRSHDGGTGYSTVDQSLDRAIARVAEAVQYLPDRRNARYASRRAVLTRRERELWITVGNDLAAYQTARDLADELAAECAAYHRACDEFHAGQELSQILQRVVNRRSHSWS